MEFIGNVVYIDLTKDASKNEKPFLVRTLGIETNDEVNGRVYTGYIGFQATGDKCEKFDSINLGDKVKIHFSVNGTCKEQPTVEGTEKNPKSKVIYTNLTAYAVEVLERASTGSTTSPHAPVVNATGGKDDLPF